MTNIMPKGKSKISRKEPHRDLVQSCFYWEAEVISEEICLNYAEVFAISIRLFSGA